MVNPISAGVLEIWDDWKIKGSVLGSLGIQISLVLLSPLRKKTSLRAVIAMVWSCYLLADGAAVFGLGQIFNIKQETGSECNSRPPSSSSAASKNNEFGDLAVLWCTFLLVHLGGPDTITAFSLPDTQLWLRQFIQMLVQAVSTFHLILLTLPCNKVIGPTLLMLIVGIVKYSERCVSLYLASVREVGKWQSTSADFEKLMASDDLTTVLPPVETTAPPATATPTPHEDVQRIVSEAYDFRGARRAGTFFARPEDGLRITEVVMNMIYEKVFSKALVLHCVWGYTLRFLTLFFTAAALFLFWFQGRDHYYDYYATKHVHSDIGVTYVLFWGAIVLELYSILMLFFSDWTLGKFDKSPKSMGKCLILPALRRLAGFKMIKWDGGDGDGYACGNVFFRRWSRRVSRYSLTRAYHLCCDDEDGKYGTMTPKSFCSSSVYVNVVRKLVAGAVALRPFAAIVYNFCQFEYDELMYVSHEPLTLHFWQFIFGHLRWKISQPKPHNFTLLSGGCLALKPTAKTPRAATSSSSTSSSYNSSGEDNDNDDPYISLVVGIDEQYTTLVMEDMNFGRSLLIWNMATDMIYAADGDEKEPFNNAKRFSKMLSDYMLYLLVLRKVWPQMGTFQGRFWELCVRLEKLGKEHGGGRGGGGGGGEGNKLSLVRAIDDPKNDTDIKDLEAAKLFDCAAKLARILLEAADRLGGGGREEMWRVVGSVWAEKLLLGAMKCDVNTHLELMCRGGELLTLVWLFTAKIGFCVSEPSTSSIPDHFRPMPSAPSSTANAGGGDRLPI